MTVLNGQCFVFIIHLTIISLYKLITLLLSKSWQSLSYFSFHGDIV
jgi:hypothetical protein